MTDQVTFEYVCSERILRITEKIYQAHPHIIRVLGYTLIEVVVGIAITDEIKLGCSHTNKTNCR